VKDLLQAIRDCGSTYEMADSVLFAIDVPPDVRVDSVFAALALGVQSDLWDVEVGSHDGPTIL
jgi:hypothetical protein